MRLSLNIRLVWLAAAVAVVASSGPVAASGQPPLLPLAPAVSDHMAQFMSAPPAEIPDDRLVVLSEPDVALYRRIFALQEAGNWDAADELIAGLDQDLLMGHVLFQRYMHPTDYRSKFSELSAWLSEYRDHPGAGRVYRLAKRRQGRARAPVRPLPYRMTAQSAETETDQSSVQPRRALTLRRHIGQVIARVNREIRRHRPGWAEKRFWAIDKRAILTDDETSELLSRLATAYFFDGNYLKARALAEIGLERSLGTGATQSLWIAGIAAWRLEDCDAAFDHFAALARRTAASSWLRSAGGYWAARTALVCRNPSEVSPYLQIAAAEQQTFYGLIAMRQLGIEPDINWSEPPLTKEIFKQLEDFGPARRAIALKQVGQIHLADEEIRLAWGRERETLKDPLAAFAARLDLPASQYWISREDGDRAPAALRYPMPDWEPEGGFKIDRALLFAVIRQESQFLVRARSYANAHGLMQVLPTTASYITRDRSLRWKRSRLFEPEFNMALGQQYVNYLQNLPVTEGNLFMLLAAYNGGPGNLGRWRRQMDFANDPLTFIESIPVRQTRIYIERVLANLWLYRLRLGQATPSLDAVAAGAWPTVESVDGHQALVAATDWMTGRHLARSDR